jgi:hypothetical protein
MKFVFKDMSKQFQARLLTLKFDVPPEFNHNLAKIILEKEPVILEQHDHTPVAGMKKTTTTAWKHYNVLSWRSAETELLKQIIQNSTLFYCKFYHLDHLPQYVSCWANVLREGQKFRTHSHGKENIISGVYYVSGVGGNSGITSYRIKDENWGSVMPGPGMMNLFPANLEHQVSEYQEEEPRISIAFDLFDENEPRLTCVKLDS